MVEHVIGATIWRLPLATREATTGGTLIGGLLDGSTPTECECRFSHSVSTRATGAQRYQGRHTQRADGHTVSRPLYEIETQPGLAAKLALQTLLTAC